MTDASQVRVDLDTTTVDLGTLPRFQQASAHARLLRRLVVGLAVCASLVWIVALILTNPIDGSLWRPLLNEFAAMLLLLAAATRSAYQIAAWRCKAMGHPDDEGGSSVQAESSESAPDEAPGKPAGSTWSSRMLMLANRTMQEALRRMGIRAQQALGLAALSVFVLFQIFWVWDPQLPGAPVTGSAVPAAMMLLVPAFALLVLERYFANRSAAEWPEAAAMRQLTRAATLLLLLSAGIVALNREGATWPNTAAVFIGLIPAAIAAEFVLRAFLSLFSPPQERVEPQLLARSILADLLQWPLHPVQMLHDELQSRFGIDLRQSWALAFIRRAFMPVLAAMLVLGWLLTGIAEIPIDGRGIYERFGAPVRVLQPGLHAGLPWPFARVRTVENGVVHELTTVVTSDNENENEPEISLAEDPPPRSANRLWDASHVAEKSQLIASSGGGRQNFQIINMDVRFIYRVALSDAGAMAATYRHADPAALIRSVANRILVQSFASRTLDDVLGMQRAQLASDIGDRLQVELTRLESGVEILGTAVEAIHPPAGAANAYHSVQAAQITALAEIARERGSAAEQVNFAQQEAAVARANATAAAREVRSGAEAAALRFKAEQAAYRSAGKAFLLEEYLSQLKTGLAGARVVVVDHRIAGGAAATIDLRKYSTDSSYPTSAERD
jgi:regulator of protease activity HflC (stomatin/prohibitin superfamily)